MRIRQSGQKVLYDPFSVVTHHEYATSGKSQATEWMTRNQSVFVERWRQELSTQPDAAPRDRVAIRRASTSRSKGRVFVIDERLPAFDQGAGYPRMFQFLTCAKEFGFQVTFAHDVKTELDGAYSTVLRKKHIEVLSTDTPHQWLKNNGELCDVVVLSRPHVFARYHQPVRR